MSIIVPSRHTGIGAWVNSNLYTYILYNFINFHARVLYKHTEYTGSLGFCFMLYGITAYEVLLFLTVVLIILNRRTHYS